MTDAAAFQATVHGFRTVPTRKVVQITIEAPIEQHSTIAAIAEHGAWVAVARLQQPPASTEQAAPEQKPIKERTPWPDMPFTKQAGMRCKEGAFQKWVVEEKGFNQVKDDPELNAACYVREFCGVNTRGALTPKNEVASAYWRSLESEYSVWLRM